MYRTMSGQQHLRTHTHSAWPTTARVARFRLFEAKTTKLAFFVNWLTFENFSSSWLFKKSLEVYIVNSKNFSFLKTEFRIFQLQAPGNPDYYVYIYIYIAKTPRSNPNVYNFCRGLAASSKSICAAQYLADAAPIHCAPML